MLAGAYANAIIQIIFSHMLSSGAYSFRPKKKVVKIVGRFSLPIYINATMLFAAMQGDRMVVAGMFNKREVALYAVACTLGQGVTTLIGKVAERLLLPIFAPKGASLDHQRRRVSRIGLLFVVGAFLFQIFITIFGRPHLTRIVYGPAYNHLNGYSICVGYIPNDTDSAILDKFCTYG